ncbi:MAG: phosphoribosylformylglycinamidine cyclo-ligase [Candidatus Caenarcaniphilales bacterium]|nr:phosphoribosylformylglycinamidine cyclo-ligase [Candidatus Caenarcaniphilales bacterium]
MSYSYKKAGVNLESAEQFVDSLKTILNTRRSVHDLSGIGGFAGLYRFPAGYQKPVLVAATDGVGTKLKLAYEHQLLSGIGQDLVAMCANDLLCCGAKPLFFLDYLAASKLDPEAALSIAKSILSACDQHEMSLLGGETAELPDMLPVGGYELAGFCLGIVEEDRILGPSKTEVGDLVIGITSSGLHSNGFSLVRKIIAGEKLDLSLSYDDHSPPLIEELLKPTELYYPMVKDLFSELKSIAHITGGGLAENLPRAYREDLCLHIKRENLPTQAILEFLRKAGSLSQSEIDHTFNQGIGLALIIAPEKKDLVVEFFSRSEIKLYELGILEPKREDDSSLSFEP